MPEYQRSRLPVGKIFFSFVVLGGSAEPGYLSDNVYGQLDLIHETLIIFVVSTTGSGQEPRLMTTLWNMLLRSDLPDDLLEDLRFAVFGLGDSSYEKFCWPAKKLSRRLLGLGATQVCDRGEGDDQHHFGCVPTRERRISSC
jgi:sulfite reductase alpha subunit-like flavoprotein